MKATHDDEPFSVLSIDGGGVRGIFVAAVLAGLERDIGTKVTDHFDLIVGTSTGGIIALGLGADMSPAEILELYIDNMDAIFPVGRDDKGDSAVAEQFVPKGTLNGPAEAVRPVLGADECQWPCQSTSAPRLGSARP